MASLNFERLLSSKIRRRQVLIGAGGLTGLAIATQLPTRAIAQAKFSDYPFKLGVASGEPLPNSVILWTRLAPDPLNGGGVSAANVSVQWQIATDENMRQIVYQGTEIATRELGHSVHVEVGGLQPSRWYWYQFKVGNEVSPIGRTRTAPNRRDRVNRFRFAFASCQNWQQGYFTPYKYMAQEDLDLVVHLGDYIYEGGVSATAVRPHNGSEPYTLEEYRNRHALYKTDPNLQATHAAFPWIVTWDDHEVDNNYADEVPQDPELQLTEDFLRRRAAAYQVYYEHMPLRRFSIPRGPDMQLYRRLTFGDLAEFNVLDTRQYRSDQACGDGQDVGCAEALDPSRTITGAEQERWLFEGLARSQARWNILAQQVFMAQRDFDPEAEVRLSMDAWDGYAASRDRLFDFIQKRANCPHAVGILRIAVVETCARHRSPGEQIHLVRAVNEFHAEPFAQACILAPPMMRNSVGQSPSDIKSDIPYDAYVCCLIEQHGSKTLQGFHLRENIYIPCLHAAKILRLIVRPVP